jgi:hypothetical protein
MIKPTAQITIPMMSGAVPNAGLDPPPARSDTAGELRTTTGIDTVQTYKYKSLSSALFFFVPLRLRKRVVRTHKICTAKGAFVW